MRGNCMTGHKSKSSRPLRGNGRLSKLVLWSANCLKPSAPLGVKAESEELLWVI